MEIRRSLFYVIFNCFLIQYLDAKTFSLNDVVAAESQHLEKSDTELHPKLKATGDKLGSLAKRLKSLSRSKKLRVSNSEQDSVTKPSKNEAAESQHQDKSESKLHSRIKAIGNKRRPLTKRLTSLSRVKKLLAANFGQGLDKDNRIDKFLSPLKYRKSYQIKNPLKPKKYKLIQKSRYKRKNQSTKRDFKYDGKRKQNEIPLLKSLSLLFDNLLDSDASESVEIKTKKYKRNRFYFEDSPEVPFTDKSNYRTPDSQPKEKAVITSTTSPTEISFVSKNRATSTTTSTPTDHTTTRDFSTFRQYTNLPVLLPRNTSSSRRNNYGDSEGSSTTLHRNYQGHLPGNNGNHEHTPGIGEDASDAEDDAENTDGHSRNGTRGFRSPGGAGNSNNTGILSRGIGTNESTSKNETANDYIRQNQLEDRRNKTEGPGVLQEPFRGLRGLSEDHNEIAEFVRPKEIRKESIVNVADYNSGNQRISDRSSPAAAENQEVRKGNETIAVVEIKTNSTTSNSTAAAKKSPMVMIFDGYSITRHKNGENKFAEKSIRIRS